MTLKEECREACVKKFTSGFALLVVVPVLFFTALLTVPRFLHAFVGPFICLFAFLVLFAFRGVRVICPSVFSMLVFPLAGALHRVLEVPGETLPPRIRPPKACVQQPMSLLFNVSTFARGCQSRKLPINWGL